MATVGPGGVPSIGIANISNMKCRCCCICKNTICLDATNPDWEYWACDKTAPFFVSDTEIQYDMAPIGFTGKPCDNGNGSSETLAVYGTVGFAIRIYGDLTIKLTCNADGTVTLVANITTRCRPATSTGPDDYYEVSYDLTATIPINTESCACSTISSSSFVLSGTVTHGTPPTPLGSLSPVTLSLSDGPCVAPLSAMRSAAPTTRTTLCTSLGERVEFRAGCDSGWMCRHKCNSTDPIVLVALGGVLEAVPGDDCQTCPGYVPRPSQS